MALQSQGKLDLFCEYHAVRCFGLGNQACRKEMLYNRFYLLDFVNLLVPWPFYSTIFTCDAPIFASLKYVAFRRELVPSLVVSGYRGSRTIRIMMV